MYTQLFFLFEKPKLAFKMSLISFEEENVPKLKKNIEATCKHF